MPEQRPVILVAPGEIFGGAERQIMTLIAVGNVRVRYRVCLFHDSTLAERLRAAGVAVTILPQGLKALGQIRAILAETGAGVVHVHGYRASIVVSLASVGLGCRIVKTVHGAPEFRQPTLLRRLLARLYFGIEAILDATTRPTLVFVTNELRSRWPGPKKALHVSVIHNGVEPIPGNFSRPGELSNQRPNVVFAGRLESVKGLEYAIAAMDLLGEAAPQLVVVGDGPDRAILSNRVERMLYGDRVRFVGFRADVYPFFAHADVVVMPSLHEGLPYTLMEAMVLGTPVVASAVGGILEVVEPGQEGLLVPPRDAKALAEAIVRLLGDKGLRESIVTKARVKARGQLSAATMAARYEQLYFGGR